MKLAGPRIKTIIQVNKIFLMRIGLLVYGDINAISGGYLYDRKLVEILRQNGDEVEIISLKKKSYIKALFTNAIPQEFEKFNQLKGFQNDKALKLDVLIQDELVHPSFWKINPQLKKILKCPIVSLVHLLSSAIPNAYLKKALYRTFEKRYLKSVDALILNSEATLRQSQELLGNKLPENLIAVPCGNNFKELEATNKDYDSAQLNILFVGNITPQKGLHVLVKALYKLDRNICLSIVGREDLDHPYTKSIKNYIKINGLEKQIIFYGPLTGEELKQKYLEHDLFVLPSVNEAYGIVFLEAMQFSLPVIGSLAGGAKEIIDEGKNGYLIEVDDEKKLAELIARLNDDRQLLASLSASARQKYLLHPRWEESIAKIRIFLQELIKQEESAFG